MATNVVGVVSSLRRYPVKSMLGEEIRTADVVERGVVGDRTYGLVDDETGKVVSVKRPRRWSGIFDLRAETHDDGVRVTFPDGETVAIDDAAIDARLSAHLGRKVSVATAPPLDSTFDESWVPELKNGAVPYFDQPTRTDDGDDNLIDAGQFMGPMGNFFNLGAVHLVTTGTTRRLAELAPDSRFDAHRFRPNIVVDTAEDGFVETAWQNRTMRIGDARFAITVTVPRCVMTTLEQDDLPADPDVLRTIAEHNSIDAFGTGVSYPCVGVYANVIEEGRIEAGQPVVLD